ncbi:MAG TPA: hypothetical protein VHW66_14765 [Stellaceae bacterium]|jgi:predicted transcriptional regulator|nr:hypothetical protein [Stellaceae bacterium]
MPNDIAVGAMISAELDDALARLAAARGVPKAALISEALIGFVTAEEADAEFAAAVEEARADVRARRIVHELLARKRSWTAGVSPAI